MSDDDSSGHYWHFHPRPSPATHHPPDTAALEAAEVAEMVRSATGQARPGSHRRRQSRGTVFDRILRGPVHGGLSLKVGTQAMHVMYAFYLGTKEHFVQFKTVASHLQNGQYL